MNPGTAATKPAMTVPPARYAPVVQTVGHPASVPTTSNVWLLPDIVTENALSYSFPQTSHLSMVVPPGWNPRNTAGLLATFVPASERGGCAGGIRIVC